MTAEIPITSETDNERYLRELTEHYVDRERHPKDTHIIATALQSAEYPASSALAAFLITTIQEGRLNNITGVFVRRNLSNPTKEDEILEFQDRLRATRDRRKEIGRTLFGEDAEEIAGQAKTTFYNQRLNRASEQINRERFVNEIDARFPQAKLPFRPL